MEVGPQADRSVTVAVAGDQGITRTGTRMVIDSLGFRVVGETGCGDEAIDLVKSQRPDLFVMDWKHEGADGVALVRSVCRSSPEIRILVLSSTGDRRQVLRAIRAGAKGFCFRDASAEEFARALFAVACGDLYISPGVPDDGWKAVRRIDSTGLTVCGSPGESGQVRHGLSGTIGTLVNRVSPGPKVSGFSISKRVRQFAVLSAAMILKRSRRRRASA